MKKIKKLKNKLMVSSIAAISALAIVAPICISTASIANVKKEVVEEDNGDTSNKVTYTYVNYVATENEEEGWKVTLLGPSKVRTKPGLTFGSIDKPVPSHSDNWSFIGWSKDPEATTEEECLKDSDIIPDAGQQLTLYPIFVKPALLSNCLCVTAIENTTVTIDLSSKPASNDLVDMWYSKDYGANWTQLTATPSTITLNAGENLYLKGDNSTGLSTDTDNYTHISFSGNVDLFGNVMGLVNNASRLDQKTKCVPNDYCFYHLFAGTSEQDPETHIQYVADNFLPCESYSEDETKTLKAHCYDGMFKWCTNLVHAPRLFATTNAVIGTDDSTAGCYQEIFYGCSSINSIRTRYDGTYAACTHDQFKDWADGVASSGDFVYNGSDSAETFDLPSTWNKYLAPRDTIYDSKTKEFTQCDITITAEAEECTADHGYQFSASVSRGTTTEGVMQSVAWITSDTSIATIDHSTGILTGKSVGAEGEYVNVYCFSKANLNAYCVKQVKIMPLQTAYTTSIKNPSTENSTKFGWTYVGTPQSGVYPTFKYSLDGGKNWFELVRDEEIEIPKNSTLYLKGDNPNGLSSGSSSSYVNFFTSSGEFELGGSIVGLINDGREYDADNITIPCDYCFNNLFAGSNVTTISPGFLPYKEKQLTEGCYYMMFLGCTKLESIPETDETYLLPATALTDKDGEPATYCYAYMFRNCSSLTDPIKLPATTLSDYCYTSMFYNCTQIKSSSALPAETATDSCYAYMFQFCTSLTYINPISLESFASKCCFQMFCYVSWAYENHSIDPDTSNDKVLIMTTPSSLPDDSTDYMFYKSKDEFRYRIAANTKVYMNQSK